MIRTLNQSNDLVNVVLVVGLAIIGNGELSVGGFGSAVTVGEVVNDDLQELLGASALAQSRGIGKVSAEIRDLSGGVYMDRS